MLTILSPVPEPKPRIEADAVSKHRLGTKIRLGVLSNGKPNTDLLVLGLLEVLLADHRLDSTVRERKSSASEPADEAILARLVSSADLVVGATAD
jgi:hypothetical protein